jgi:hypothetical protein
MSNPQWPEQSSDPYGQPQYGQPGYVQPVYGQPVYGQPVYGHPVYGQQPDFGPPQYATPAYAPRASFSAHLGQSSMPLPPLPPAPPRSKRQLAAAICAGVAVVLVLALVVVRSGGPPSQPAHSGTIAQRVTQYWEAGGLDDLVELTCAADHPYLSDAYNTSPENFTSGAYTSVRTGPVHRHGYLYAVPVMFKFQGGVLHRSDPGRQGGR